MTQRIIKFRAWDKADVNVYSSPTDSKRMSFYGSTFDMDDNENSLKFFTPKDKQPPFGDHNSMERYELMQFTGLLDKNGKEVYEDDVVQKGKTCWKIEWRMGMWGVYTKHYGWSPLSEWKHHEVIGNIYENPELLTK